MVNMSYDFRWKGRVSECEVWRLVGNMCYASVERAV